MPIPRWAPVLRAARAAALGLLLFLAAGNALIYGASWWAGQSMTGAVIEGVEGVGKLRSVDAELWRGSAPTREGYRDLAARGVSTIVDLRAEEDARDEDRFIRSLGIDVVHLPVRDGQAPSERAVSRLIDVVARSRGTVFLHCGAGVGRTGAMAAAYLVASGQAGPREALAGNLAIGPPSLEQIAFVSELDGNDVDRPNPVVVAASRMLDAPRRLWSVATG